MSWDDMVTMLERHGVQFEAGLSDDEVHGVEERLGFVFPPDLRAFLQTALPVRSPRDQEFTLRKRGFPNWRHGDPDELAEYVRDPFDAVLDFVEEDGFWLPQWPARPRDPAAAVELVKGMLAEAPKLIPVYKHRLMPDRPREEGNPVFSFEQPDNIMCYGRDLRTFLVNEFGKDDVDPRDVGNWKVVPFWDIDAFSAWRR